MTYPTNRIQNWLVDDDFIAPIPSLQPAETLDEIVLICPEVDRIFQRARSIRKPTWKHYEALKQRLMVFVGWTGMDERLKTELAYDLCLRRMVDELGI